LGNIGDVTHILLAVATFPDLLAEVGAGATVAGGIVGLVISGTSKSRQSLEDLALGAAIGGFFGSLISVVVYLVAKVVGS
jgi:hypothetical protein